MIDKYRFRIVIPLLCLGVVLRTGWTVDWSARFVYPDAKTGQLRYDVDARGDQILDFSHCGYGGGGIELPQASVSAVVKAAPGDATERIQLAIDTVSKRPLDANGLRGAVLLEKGNYDVSGQLRISASGVVLRGEVRLGENLTTITATGNDRRTLISIRGEDGPDPRQLSSRPIVNHYVPAGTRTITLPPDHGLSVGSQILIEHPSTKEWIASLGMDRFPSRSVGSWVDWKPGTLDLRWEREVVAVDGDSITFDVPLSYGLDRQLSQSVVRDFAWPGRIENVGVESLRLISAFDPDRPYDEEHAWDAVSFHNVRDGWVRDVSMVHFAGSAVHLLETTSRISVLRCASMEPVSEIGGYRRRTFFTAGGQTLFRQCTAHAGRNDFAVGHLAPGPNAFVDCSSRESHGPSGPLESFCTGVLYDNLDLDGAALQLANFETANQGVGWSGVNCVLWQCSAPMVVCQMLPPVAGEGKATIAPKSTSGQNWAIGCWGEFRGDGHWRNLNEFVSPKILYDAQLQERSQQGLRTHRTLSLAAESHHQATRDLSPPIAVAEQRPASLQLLNGWLTLGEELLTGERLRLPWWRGHTLPERTAEFGPALTRFVPGRELPGYTDDLHDVAKQMKQRGQVVVEHHWGLWYDRRRDDHQMIRRLDGSVWAPFYELPWARSGQGTAWDGLSRYDLERFNTWYFRRLSDFAEICDQSGLVLIQHIYFQHNILEAGAHWADFPWRPVNCLQSTGFPEPPPYENRKRIDVSAEFYDITHPLRRELHRKYIRHCLDSMANHSNVIFTIGEEFTGPKHFVRFWLETIQQWRKDTGLDPLIALSCTRDVQDDILNEEGLSNEIDIIDLKYWWYLSDGTVYAPPGDQHLAPRQQLREWKGTKSRSASQIARQIREYRLRFPSKAVICSIDGISPAAVLAGGGSLAPMEIGEKQLRKELPNLVPMELPGKDPMNPPMILGSKGNDKYLVVRSEVPQPLGLPTSSTKVAVIELVGKNFKFGKKQTAEVSAGVLDFGDQDRNQHQRQNPSPALWIEVTP